ncbi:MAG: RidA family protein [Gemmatimonadaceae bacterium]
MRKIVDTERAPKAIGPYSQGIAANGFLFTAGQIALDPLSGSLIEGGISAQTERVLSNLGAVLDAAGTSWENVVKTTVYLADFKDFAVVNDIYGRVLGESRPARSTVQAAALPRGALIEIDAVVALTSS